MEPIIYKAKFLIDILTANKHEAFKMQANKLPISLTMSVFLDDFCLHVTCFVRDIEDCITKLENRQVKDWSVIEVLEMMK